MSADKPSLESLFEAAIAIECAEARAHFIEQQCGENLQLRADLEQLLESDNKAGSFLEKPPAALRGIPSSPSADQNLKAALDAGLATAFSMDEAIVMGSPNHSVLSSLSATVDLRSVALRESGADGCDPISRPLSQELPPPEAGSRYQLQGEIARGGMGAILKGRDTDLGRDLAVKVLLDEHKAKPSVIQRFIEEAQIGGQLQHPGIAPVYELGMFADQRPFFSMKLVKGQTLSKLLSDRSDPSEDRHRFVAILEQICQTMAYAHSRGVIHRDLKPANIMVGAFGEVQVMDWGLAKVLSTGGVADEKSAHSKHRDFSVIQTMRNVGSDSPLPLGSSGSATQMGSVMGTPAYMPPEQALGEVDQVDERADVFGLGAILCEILTGKPPYVGDDSTQVYRLASRGKLGDCLARLERCKADAELVTLAVQCLELEPKDRPRDASAVAARVTDYMESVDTKLREAEMARATQAARADAEAARAIAESERADAESRRAAEESKRRRVSLVLAASIVMFVALGSGGSLYMLQREAAQQKSARENSRRVLDLSLEVLAKSGTDPKTNREYTVRSALANLSNLLKATTTLQPETEAELHLGLGIAFLGGGDRTRAQHHLRRSVEIGSKFWDQNNPQLLSARRLEAYVSQSRARLVEAIDMDRASNDRAGLVKSLTFMGDVAAQKGDADTAESVLKEAVEKFPEDLVDEFQFYEIPHLAFADVLRDHGANEEAARIRSVGQRVCKFRFGELDEVWFRIAIQLEEAGLADAANRAFAVGLSCVPKTPVNWFRGRGQNYRKEGNFLNADIAFRFGVEHANARNAPGEAAFAQVSLGRQRYDVKDFEGAEPYIREAVRLASGGYAAAKINYEYGKLLRNLGRASEADEYLQASIQHWDRISESYADNSFLTPAMADTFRIACRLLMRDNEPARQSVVDFIKDESVAGSYRGVVLAHAIMVYGGLDVDLERAAALLECSLQALGHPLTAHEIVIEAYVNIMDQLGRTERAIANLNRYRYVFCDLGRDRTNFRRADFRISIAEAMMARGLDPQRSKHLLSQAKEILEYNPLTPQRELDDLDRLIAECDSVMQADRPGTFQVPE